MLQNGVIETATGDLLRAGFCDFESDGSFDAGTETMRTDCPCPANIRGDPEETQMHQWTGSAWQLVAQPLLPAINDSMLTFTFQNNGAVLNLGIQEAACLVVPYDCTIQVCRMLGNPSGSIVVDLWVDDYANYPPTDADSIVASSPPTISGGVKSEDSIITGWIKNLKAGEMILPNIDSVENMSWAKLVLLVRKG